MTIFFDIDDTLYDRGMPFQMAVTDFFEDFPADIRKAYQACTHRGDEVFLPSQRGEISMDEMYIYRWSKGFSDVGVTIKAEDALTFQTLYRKNQNRIKLSAAVDRMLAKCLEISDGLGIITNGPSEKQWSKIKCLGLERIFSRELMIVSGDVGIDKPDTAIFHLAESRCGKLPGDILFVGDSLPNDIMPASICGWHTIWFDRNNQAVFSDIDADAIVKTEEEMALAVFEFAAANS